MPPCVKFWSACHICLGFFIIGPKLSQAFRLTMAPFNYKTQFLMRPSGIFIVRKHSVIQWIKVSCTTIQCHYITVPLNQTLMPNCSIWGKNYVDVELLKTSGLWLFFTLLSHLQTSPSLVSLEVYFKTIFLLLICRGKPALIEKIPIASKRRLFAGLGLPRKRKLIRFQGKVKVYLKKLCNLPFLHRLKKKTYRSLHLLHVAFF